MFQHNFLKNSAMPRLIKPVTGFALFALLAGCSYMPSAAKLGLASSEPPRQVGERRQPLNNAATMAQMSEAASAPVPVSEALAREATGILTPGAPVQGFAQASADPIATPPAQVAAQQEPSWWDRNFGPSPSMSASYDNRRVPTENPGGTQIASTPMPEALPDAPQASYPALSSVPQRDVAPAPGGTAQAMNALETDRDRVAQDASSMKKDMVDQKIGEPLPPPAADQYVSVPRPIITTSEPVTPREPIVREITPSSPAEQEVTMAPPPAGAPREIMPPLPPATASAQDFSDPNGAISTTPIAVAPAPEVASVSQEPSFIAEPPAAPLLREPEARGQRFLPDSRYAARRATQRMAHSGF